jgi:hypothetical protein
MQEKQLFFSEVATILHGTPLNSYTLWPLKLHGLPDSLLKLMILIKKVFCILKCRISLHDTKQNATLLKSKGENHTICGLSSFKKFKLERQEEATLQ